jgi:hypothetical protein
LYRSDPIGSKQNDHLYYRKYQEFVKCEKVENLGKELKIEVDFEKLAIGKTFDKKKKID